MLSALKNAATSRSRVDPARAQASKSAWLRGPHVVPELSAAILPFCGHDPRVATPGAACATVRLCPDRSAVVVAIGCAGVRQCCTENVCEPLDEWHLGANGMSMTAALCAVLVSKGLLPSGWDLTVRDAFRLDALEWLESTDIAYHDVTLRQLLSMVGGLPTATAKDAARQFAWWQEQTVNARAAKKQQQQQQQEEGTHMQRRAYLASILSRPPAHPVGSFSYSDESYVLVGHMIETVLHEAFEELMQSHLWSPLGMSSAGFGMAGVVMAGLGRSDVVWGHGDSSGWLPNQFDNPPALAPAGCMHSSIADWAAFIATMLSYELAARLLGMAKADWDTLRQPGSGSGYALGWFTTSADWAEGTVLTHAGGNRHNHSSAWLAPDGDVAPLAMLICTNTGFDAPHRKIAEALIAMERTRRGCNKLNAPVLNIEDSYASRV